MIKLTSNALVQMKKLFLSRDQKPKGVRIGIETKGCSGLSYTMQFVDNEIDGDEMIKVEDIKIYVYPKASFFLLGTEIDYEESDLESGFKFNNPNEKGRCGCGESFHI